MPPTPSATYERLREYIAKRMRMSHIYQPLMLMELLGRRSPAPAQDVARRILGEDVTQIDYYTERVKRMVGKVLTGNGITRYERGTYDLVGGEELSDVERDELLQLCRQRLDAFREQRGEEVFAHRSRHRTPISGSIKYRVLTRAKGRCEYCGAHEQQRALEVDHIVPRNQGGSDDLSNLQALCFRCNAGKRDNRYHRLPRIAGQLRQPRGGLCVLRAGGQRLAVGMWGLIQGRRRGRRCFMRIGI
jgi:5-methylcytosine-specific restriction endonuclease McrA